MSSDKKKEIITIANASDEHPRHSEASVIELKDGKLMIAWMEYLESDIGSGDNAPNRISVMISDDEGLTWGEHRVIIETKEGSVNSYSPNFIRLTEEEIILIYFNYLVLEAGKPPATRAFLKRTCDEGKTFTESEVIWDSMPINFASSVVKKLLNGRVIIPVAKQTGNIWSSTDHFDVGCAFSDDEGKTWEFSDNWIYLPMRGCSEGHIEELRNGQILMVLRTQLGSVFKSYSDDGGKTWSKAQTTGMKAPESCPDLNRIPQTGDLMLTWNNSLYDPRFISHYGKRTPLTVAISKDEGETWTNIKDIEDNPYWGYSNPACTFTTSGKGILTYWATKYKSDWRMGGPISLKAAIFDIGWLYS